MNNELVSVVVPVYNRAGTVLRAVNSVLEQTYVALECIVVDDGSTDNTENVVGQIKDSRLRYIKLEQNRGPSIARNAGIRASRGKYIAFNDSDDIWLPEKLEAQMEKIKSEEEIGLVYCGYSYHRNGKEMKVPSDRYDELQLEGYIFDSLWQENKIGTPAILIRKECVDVCGGFAENIRSLEDWEYVLRISEKYKIAYVNKVLVHACYSSQGVNEQYELQAETIWHILKQWQRRKQNDRHMVSLLFQKLALVSDRKKISCWGDRLVPSIAASRSDFELILSFAKEKNIIQRANRLFAKMTDFEVLKEFINTNIDLGKDRIAIYGAGDIGICLGRLLNLLGISYEYIIDKNDISVDGLEIVKPSRAWDGIDKVIVTIMAAAEGKADLELPDRVQQVNLFDIID